MAKPRPLMVRNRLFENETMCLDGMKKPFIFFLGTEHGIALVESEGFIETYYLCEDDEQWFVPPKGYSPSAFWLQDNLDVLRAVLKWLAKHADKTWDGWKVRK